MTVCVHGVFACVCSFGRERRGEGAPQKTETARRRHVYEDTDTPTEIIPRYSLRYTTTLLGTHYTHNNRKCVQSVGTILGGYSG